MISEDTNEFLDNYVCPVELNNGDFWQVIYECRDTIVEVFVDVSGYVGFLAPGQDALWHPSACTWIRKIPMEKTPDVY